MRLLRTLHAYLTTPRIFRSRAQVERWQRRRLKRHMAFVRRHSTFYREHWEDISGADWRRFPTIDKAVMMENLQELLTVPLEVDAARALAQEAERSRDFSPKIGDLSIGFSSGTSGARGMHVVSAREQAHWAGFMLKRGLGGSILGRHRIALFLRANSNTFESIGSRRIRFDFYDLTRPIADLVTELETQPPDVLIAPPSVLRHLADVGCSVRPRRVTSAAEVLTPLDRKVIDSHFGTIVHQFYSSTEGEIAATCEHGTLHLNESTVHIQKEWVDETRGWYHPIITDFRRRTQPIIRYRQNDILVARTTPCPCGDAREAVEAIMGREDDVFLLARASGEGVEPLVPDLLRRAVLEMDPALESYQVEQVGADHIVVRLSPLPATPSMEGFERLWRLKAVAPPHITIEACTLGPSAVKLRRVMRSWDGA